MQVFVPYLGPSLNSIYAGVHWSKRKKDVKHAHLMTKMACRKMEERGALEKIDGPVRLVFRPVLGRGVRARDCSNYAYSAKMIEDGFVRAGVLNDDSIKYVKSFEILEPVRDKELGSGMLVTIEKFIA